MTPKTLILLIDFSETTTPLMSFCADWCRTLRSNSIPAELLLLHHLSTKTPVITDEQTRKELLRAKRDDAERHLYALAQSFSDLSARYLVTEGNFSDTLNDLISQIPSSLVALGLKPSSSLKRLFIGSKASEIIDHCHTPVIALPNTVSHFNVETLFISANRHYPINLISLNKLLTFIGDRLKRLYFFTIVDEGAPIAPIETYLSELSETYRHTYLVGRFLLKSDNFVQDLHTLLYDKHRELLVLQRGSRLLSDMLFRKMFINDIVYSGSIPIAVLS
ncbi:universal stress protein [Rhodoflexus sp.]